MTHPALIDDHFETIIERVESGISIGKALKGTGFATATFYRRLKANAEMAKRYQEALELGGFLKRDEVDDVIERRAKANDAPPAIVLAWAKRHHSGYREKSTVEHIGGQTHRVMHVDLTEVAKIMAESGVVIDHEPARDVPRAELLPPSSD